MLKILNKQINNNNNNTIIILIIKIIIIIVKNQEFKVYNYTNFLNY